MPRHFACSVQSSVLLSVIGSVAIGAASISILFVGPVVRKLLQTHNIERTRGSNLMDGIATGLAGIVLAMRLDSVQPTAGVTYELDTIAAVVIGGTSLTGGKGGIFGTIIGVLIIGVLRNGLNLLSVSPFLQAVVIGIVIALAVAAESFKKAS